MATHTGWAAGDTMDPWRISQSGVWYYGNGKRPFELPKRLLLFRDDLNRAIDETGAVVLVYEIAHHRGGPATRSGIGMETVLVMTGYSRGLYVQGVHSASLKKFATGNGRAEKDDMIRVANETSPKIIRDDNEADAFMLLNWGRTYVETGKNGTIRTKVQAVSTKRKTKTKEL